MLMSAMPVVTFPSTLDASLRPLFDKIVGRGGRLRASKPPVSKDDPTSGEAAYVWRMVAFQVSPNGKHHCMPCTADFDLPTIYWDRTDPSSHDRRRARIKELDAVVDAIVNTVPKNEWHGIRRWSRAFYG